VTGTSRRKVGDRGREVAMPSQRCPRSHRVGQEWRLNRPSAFGGPSRHEAALAPGHGPRPASVDEWEATRFDRRVEGPLGRRSAVWEGSMVAIPDGAADA
jgi:hypothetical protein